MLVLSRKKGESVMIDDHIEVKVIAVEGDIVKLGIEAPQRVSIHRHEIYEAIQQENKRAAHVQFDVTEINKLVKVYQQDHGEHIDSNDEDE